MSTTILIISLKKTKNRKGNLRNVFRTEVFDNAPLNT